MPGFGTCRTLPDISFICFVVSLLSQLKHMLGLADQRARHTSTFECVRLCSEGKIQLVNYDYQNVNSLCLRHSNQIIHVSICQLFSLLNIPYILCNISKTSARVSSGFQTRETFGTRPRVFFVFERMET